MEFRDLRADEVDVRVSRIFGKNKDTVSLLLYKDARVDMSILDETVGPERWQRSHELINGNLFCNVGIYVDRRGDGYGEWVWKQDVGTESNTEKEKGQASDSFKRACTNWGIGRELYTAPDIVFFHGEFQMGTDGKCYDYFKCVDLVIENKRIKSVTIQSVKNGKKKTFTQDVSVIAPTKGGINREKFASFVTYLKKEGIEQEDVAKAIGVPSMEEMTADQWNKWLTEYQERKGAKK